MGKRIPLDSGLGAGPAREIEIDAAIVAEAFGLDTPGFRKLMEQHKISVLCERGTGDDAGRFRASFYLGRTRVRLVVDSDGNLCEPVQRGAPGQR